MLKLISVVIVLRNKISNINVTDTYSASIEDQTQDLQCSTDRAKGLTNSSELVERPVSNTTTLSPPQRERERCPDSPRGYGAKFWRQLLSSAR
jgi:hypothetical protein